MPKTHIMGQSTVNEKQQSDSDRDPRAAEQFLSMVYDELRKLAFHRIARENPGQTLQATALVHEVWLRLAGADDQPRVWKTRGHFFGAAAEAMRRILIEKARHKQSLKAGGDWERVATPVEQLACPAPGVDLSALSEALDHLSKAAPRAAEVVKLRYFIGMTLKEVAASLEVAESTVDADWAYAKSWLHVRLADQPRDPTLHQ